MKKGQRMDDGRTAVGKHRISGRCVTVNKRVWYLRHKQYKLCGYPWSPKSLVVVNKDVQRIPIPDISYNDLLWTPAQRKRASMLYFANVFFKFFYGRLILRPWWTEVRESFTRGGPWVSLKKLLLWFFLVILKLQGGPKSDEISHIFRPRPQTFCYHARTRQNIVILKKTR